MDKTDTLVIISTKRYTKMVPFLPPVVFTVVAVLSPTMCVTMVMVVVTMKTSEGINR